MKEGSEETRAGGYNPIHFASLFAVEDRHFWFRARNQVISALMTQVVASLSPGYRVLEVGCGDGNVLRFLEKACSGGHVTGMDLHGEGLTYARRRVQCPLVQADVSLPPFCKTFQVVGIFDVLEHISDDRRILDDLRKLLDHRGTLLLTVPAHPHLWSYFDEAAGHCRRYRVNELRSKLEQTGYSVEYLTEYMAGMHPLVLLYRKTRPAVISVAQSPEELVKREVRIVPVLNEVLSFVLSLEAKWIAARKLLPLGASLVAVARKID